MHKLSKYGIKGKLLKWFEAFLKNRRQRVVLGEPVSEWGKIKSGGPQGSVIGPILFLIYINDLPDKLNNLCKMYADDSKILAKVRKNNELEDTNKMQNDIDTILDLTNTWLMRLNIEKCKVMHIGKKNNYTIKSYENEERFI